MVERLDGDREAWGRFGGSARKAEPTEGDQVAEATKKIERLQAETYYS